MSESSPPTHVLAADPVEKIVHVMPLVLPIAGAVLMFLLAFIAVNMG